ncbi:MAG TPA: hypothetical protein DD641_09855 [Deltaproteobacteria bacterium]|nr:hypothetical protein [Deltaproteobacteria bacterium]
MKNIILGVTLILSVLMMCGSVNALCVKVSRANIRSGPGTEYTAVWEVYKYMPFEKVGTSVSGSWYSVKDVDGDINWAHKNLLTNAFQCAVVKEAQVNVRTGPGTNYKETASSPALQYYSFRVLTKNGEWIKVKDESNKIGWIHKDFLWIK